jgi:hypothetical protein
MIHISYDKLKIYSCIFWVHNYAIICIYIYIYTHTHTTSGSAPRAYTPIIISGIEKIQEQFQEVLWINFHKNDSARKKNTVGAISYRRINTNCNQGVPTSIGALRNYNLNQLCYDFFVYVYVYTYIDEAWENFADR